MTEISLTPRVIRLGGSLLDLPNVVPRLLRWSAQQAIAGGAIVVGGGAAVDRLRERHEALELDNSTAHWMCVAAMAVNARRIATVLGVPLTGIAPIDNEAFVDGLCVLDPWRVLWEEEPRLVAERLPESWDVTSDSIAARVAELLGIEELALLKSRLPEPGWTLADAVEAGYVDRFFPWAARRLRVRCVDLRSETFAEAVLNAVPAPS
ncbi:MAG TPA: hypothetical protein VHZ24_05645 [Pirellulales bacterium]|jgi:aspartokinase-like uncharacterized kinase|nr:hypothetical protein [Pirellulales bacterium]